MTQATVPSRVPASATPDGDGIVVGAGPVAVDTYIDFLCPFCRQFELSSGDTLATLVTDGLISLAYHPMNFLDAASTTHYSTRAAASSGCASDGGRFVEYAHALFVNQPSEGGPGLTYARLIEIGRSVELTGPAFGECVEGGKYLDWPPYVTAVATALGVSATPTVLVEGIPVPANARMIAAAVQAASGDL
jgi:protein-disulfide isomerase